MIYSFYLALSPFFILNVVYGFRIVCVYESWAQFRRPPFTFVPENINASLCTHIVFNYAQLLGVNIVPTECNHDIDAYNSLYKRFTDVKLRNPNLKVILSIGGYSAGSGNLTALIRNQTSAESFARNANIFLRRRNFDGLNLAFYRESYDHVTPIDQIQFSYLVKELARSFGKVNTSSKLLLTFILPTSYESIGRFYYVPDISRYSDFVTIDTVDYYGPWSSMIWHHAPLYPSSTFQEDNVDRSIFNWIIAGMPPDKINIAIPFYGRGYQLVNNKYFAPSSKYLGGSVAQPVTDTDGFAAYFEICPLLANDQICVNYLLDLKVPYLINNTNWIGYDDQTSVANKILYARNLGLGGATADFIDLDDFRNICAHGNFTLLQIINEYSSNSANQSEIDFTSLRMKSCSSFNFLKSGNHLYIWIIVGSAGSLLLVMILITTICLIRRHLRNKEVKDDVSMNHRSVGERNVYLSNQIANRRRQQPEQNYEEIRESKMTEHAYLSVIK